MLEAASLDHGSELLVTPNPLAMLQKRDLNAVMQDFIFNFLNFLFSCRNDMSTDTEVLGRAPQAILF